MSVDESTVIFGPIDHVGWASASSIVTAASSARGAAAERTARGREHDPGHPVPRQRARVLGPQALVDRAVLAVDRDQLARAGLGPRPLHDRARRR